MLTDITGVWDFFTLPTWESMFTLYVCTRFVDTVRADGQNKYIEQSRDSLINFIIYKTRPRYLNSFRTTPYKLHDVTDNLNKEKRSTLQSFNSQNITCIL